MRKLLVILLIALTTCTAIEENLDDDVVLEKSWLKKLVPKITPKKIIPKIEPKKIIPKKIIPKVDPKKIIPKIDPKKIIPKVDPKKIIPKIDPKKLIAKIDPKKIIKSIPVLKKLPIKIDGLFKGKVGNAFKNLGDVVKKGIAWLKQNGLWDPIVDQLKEIGGGYANEICEKILPAEVCGPAVDFALNNVLKTEEEGEE